MILCLKSDLKTSIHIITVLQYQQIHQYTSQKHIRYTPCHKGLEDHKHQDLHPKRIIFAQLFRQVQSFQQAQTLEVEVLRLLLLLTLDR